MRGLSHCLVASDGCVTVKVICLFIFLYLICLVSEVLRICFVYMLRKKHLSPFADTVQKIDMYALTGVTFIYFDCCTVNIQKADMCSELGPLGPWQVINQ